jgi:hypothetical protein
MVGHALSDAEHTFGHAFVFLLLLFLLLLVLLIEVREKENEKENEKELNVAPLARYFPSGVMANRCVLLAM